MAENTLDSHGLSFVKLNYSVKSNQMTMDARLLRLIFFSYLLRNHPEQSVKIKIIENTNFPQIEYSDMTMLIKTFIPITFPG